MVHKDKQILSVNPASGIIQPNESQVLITIQLRLPVVLVIHGVHPHKCSIWNSKLTVSEIIFKSIIFFENLNFPQNLVLIVDK